MTTLIPFTEQTVAVQRPTFESIADDLEAYQETLAMIDATLETCSDDAERCHLAIDRIECNDAIERLSEALVKKTDDLAGVMRRMKADLATQKAEAKRYSDRARVTEASLDRLKAYTQATMERHGWKHLKTAKNTITLRGNGGVHPLKIDNLEAIPDELCVWTGTLSSESVSLVQKALWNFGNDALNFLRCFNRTPSNAPIREALIQPCLTCDGSGKWIHPLDGDEDTCGGCSGTGRATVPGAHLEERGSHVEIR